ncbi:hypothetical protein [Phaeovulum sp.]|uniref:hypothetical protein n=1 Tax=Phaeovulum sp. TaxID=2934796 RepID=UPI0039E2EFD8
MKPILENTSLTRATVHSDDEAFFALVVDEFAHDFENPHAVLYSMSPSTASELGYFDFAVSDLTYANGGKTRVAVGHYAEAIIIEGTTTTLETINPNEWPIRGVSEAGRDIVACGANLRVYRRLGPDNWEEFGPGDNMSDEFQNNHLESIGGYSESEIYATGRDGMIWWYDGAHWTGVQCATNLAFLSVVCAEDGYVYVGGINGIMAKGRRDEFVVYTPPAPLRDIWALQDFRGAIYCAMTRALLTWTPDEGFVPVPEAMLLAKTFYNLGKGKEVLWSLGEKDVLRFDGAAWTRIDRINVE